MAYRKAYMKKRGANLGGRYRNRRPRYRGKTAMKKARRMLRRKTTIASPQSYTTRLELVSTQDANVNVNHPTTPVKTCQYSIYNIACNAINDLTARSAIYSKFKITKIKYHFKRVVPTKQVAGINYMSIDGSDFHIAFPNTFNRLLPTPTETNVNAMMNWAQQQTNSKKFFASTDSFTKSVRPLIVENSTYQGPSGISGGADVEVSKNKKMPWLDLNSDLLDNLSLGQLVVVMAPSTVLTTIPTGTGAANTNGMSKDEAKNNMSWDVSATVTYMVKGRFLDKEIVDG